ncbi:hypothetical protein [Aeromonas eucrenophila]|uniref:Uncharacterized protein n=1 Tax=Aeromonas eucrenophila TaxID=649 RepID=A0ABW0YCW5_9GAMM|nr:hypothetical protein [Aeromonas eucrenophila]
MTDLFELEAQQDDQGTTEAGHAHMQPPAPVSQLAKHWEAARREYLQQPSGLLELGGIRTLYWLVLGTGEVALAKEIAEWWATHEQLHGLGETIK